MRSPFGDQEGSRFAEASNVKRVSVPRARSRRQISLVEPVERRNTIAFSSGEIEGSQTLPGAPTGPTSFPARSYQTIWLPAEPLLAYRRVPFSETLTSAKLRLLLNATPSAMGNTAPDACPLLTSNGWAINVFSRMNRRWPAANATLDTSANTRR